MQYKCPEWLPRPGWVIFSRQCYWNRPFRTICDPTSVTRKSTDLAPKDLRSLLTFVQDRVVNRPKPARPVVENCSPRLLLRFIFGKKINKLQTNGYTGKLRRNTFSIFLELQIVRSSWEATLFWNFGGNAEGLSIWNSEKMENVFLRSFPV